MESVVAMHAAASSGVQVLGVMVPVWHRARLPVRALGPKSARQYRVGRRRGFVAACGLRRRHRPWSVGAWADEVRYATRRIGGRARTRPSPRGDGGGRRLHVRGTPRRLHPADPCCRCFDDARPGHQRRHRLPSEPSAARPPGLGPATAVQGTLHPRLGESDPGPGRATVRGRLRPAHRAHARDGRRTSGHIRHMGDRGSARLPRGVHVAHLDAASVQPRTPSARTAADRPRWTGSADGVAGGRGCRRPAGDAVQHRVSLPGADAPGCRRRTGPGRTHTSGPHGDRRGHRLLRSRRGRARDSEVGGTVAPVLLRIHPGVPAGPRGRGMG